MQTMDQALQKLVTSGEITAEIAKEKARQKENFVHS